MGSAEVNGPLWGVYPEYWTTAQERHHIPLFEAMMDAANLAAGMSFLDVGCGGGTSSGIAAKRGAKVTALDAAEGLIEYARKTVSEADFHIGDIEELPFENESFDVVFAANSVQYAGDLLAALKELKRVCKPGGKIVAGLFGPPEGVAYGAVFAAVKEVMPPPPPGAPPGGPFALSAPGVLEGKFKEAGLNVEQSGTADCPFHYADFDELWRGCLGAGPFQKIIGVIGEDKLKEAVVQAAKSVTADDGRVTFKPNVFTFVLATP